MTRLQHSNGAGSGAHFALFFTRHSRGLLWAAAAILLGGWLLLRFPSHPNLLQKATQTAVSGDSPYQWLSNRELLVFDSAPSRSWSVARVDAQTGKHTPLPALQHALPQTSETPYFTKPSPDGKLVVRYGLQTLQVFTLEGKPLRIWGSRRQQQSEHMDFRPLFWLADGRIVFPQDFSRATETPPVTAAGAGKLLRLPCLDTKTLQRDTLPTSHVRRVPPNKGRSLNKGRSDRSASTVLDVLTAPWLPEFAAEEYYSPLQLTAGGLLYAYSSAYEETDTRTLLRLPLAPGAVASRSTFHAPPGLTFSVSFGGEERHAIVSPQGERVFWLCRSQPYTPSALVWLHRFLPRIAAPSYQWMSLYVARVDRGDMREIGGVAVPVRPGAGIAAGPFEEEIQDVRWLPDGQHISFLYHRMLYTVEAMP